MSSTESDDQDHSIRPRVCGLLSGKGWIGVSNYPNKFLKRPKTIFSMIPDDLRGSLKIEETCRSGLEDNKILGMGNISPLILKSFINLIKTYIEEFGMDTFFLWNPSTNVEVYF